MLDPSRDRGRPAPAANPVGLSGTQLAVTMAVPPGLHRSQSRGDLRGQRAATVAVGERHKYMKCMICTTLPVTGRPRSAPRLVSLAFCASLALAGCTAPAGPASPRQHSAGPGRPASPTVSAAALCASAMLRIRGGRQGENQGAHGDIEFTNIGSRPCVLRGLPRVAIVQANGKSLPVRLVRVPNLSLSPVVLPPGSPDAADLVVYWANWCGRPPGPLSVRITLPAGGVVTGPFNGPPDYNLVPPCPSPGQPSTISVIDAYGPGLAG